MSNAKRISVCILFLALILAIGAQAQTTPAAEGSLPFSLKPLGHNVYAAIDDAKGEAGANAGFVIGDDGVLVIDTFENEAAAKQLLAEIRKLTKLPIKFVVNTHYHLDHVAGNRVFKDTGAVIIAHLYVADWIQTENLKFFGKNIKPEQKLMVDSLVPPDILYTEELVLSLGKRRVMLGHQLGHTGGDTVVAVPDARVYFFGDLFWRRTLPNLIDATVADWLGLRGFAKANREAMETYTLVPGHGEVGTASDLDEFLGYLGDLEAHVREALNAGKDGDELIATVLPEMKEKYASWNFFDYFAKANIKDVAGELKNQKRVPPGPPRKP
jgi:cyclase